MKPYIEQDCTFTHESKSFTSGGAFVTASYLIAYPQANGVLGDWHGNSIGTWRVLSSWRIRSFVSDHMYSIEARVQGVRYVGRGMGQGMILRAKRSPLQDGAR